MRAVSPSQHRIRRAWLARNRRPRDDQEDALNVIRQALRQFQRLLPAVARRYLLVHTRTRDGKPALERGQIKSCAGHAMDTAAHQKVLIKHGDRAEGGFRIFDDLTHHSIKRGAALFLIDLGEQ